MSERERGKERGRMHVLYRAVGEGEGPWCPGDWVLYDVVATRDSILVQDRPFGGYALPPLFIPLLYRDVASGALEVLRLSPPVRRLVTLSLASHVRASRAVPVSVLGPRRVG